MDRKSQTLQNRQKACYSDLIFLSTLSLEFTAKYDINCPLGWGGFGFVTKITSKITDTNVELACKFIPRRKLNVHHQGLIDGIPLEAILLKSFNHENIISFHDFYKDNKYYYIITECHGLIKDCSKSPSKRASMDLFE